MKMRRAGSKFGNEVLGVGVEFDTVGRKRVPVPSRLVSELKGNVASVRVYGDAWSDDGLKISRKRL